MFNRTLRSFVPAVYDNVIEMEEIFRTEDRAMFLTRTEMASAFANTFVLTSNETGVIMFETMLGITANPATEDLEFRRQRVLSRISTSPPFTFRYLQNKLGEVIGVDAWKAYIDYDKYTLYVESSSEDQKWFSEVMFTVNRVKPCNMVFINVPYTPSVINVNEEVSYDYKAWSYRLGSWKLGQHAFTSIIEGGVIKMAQTNSVLQALLNSTANFVASDISKVLLNDSVTITQFKTKKVADNVVSLEYEVTPSMTTTITNLKLLRADGTVLTQSAVYVPVTDTGISKHIITVKEGA